MSELIDQCLLNVHVKRETDVECMHEKEYETKFLIRLLYTDVASMGKKTAALLLKRLRTDLCTLFIIRNFWQRRRLFRSTYFWLNELWDNARSVSLPN